LALELTQPLKEMRTRKCFWRVEHGRRVRLTTPPPIVYKRGSLDVSQPYRSPLPARQLYFASNVTCRLHVLSAVVCGCYSIIKNTGEAVYRNLHGILSTVIACVVAVPTQIDVVIRSV
jgi:hypothetical protein